MSRNRRGWGADDQSIGGDFWASYTDLMAGVLMVFILMVALAESAISNAHADLEELISDQAGEVEAWQDAIHKLCEDPALKVHDVEIDCVTGTIELPGKVLFDFNDDDIKSEGQVVLREAIPIILRTVLENKLLERRLNTIEVRGHADPVAVEEDKYARNLRVSQRRSRTVLEFLSSDTEVPEAYRDLLRKMGLATGAAASQKPPKCDEKNLSEKECYEAWRRVEIRLDFRDGDFRQELNTIFEKVMTLIGQK